MASRSRRTLEMGGTTHLAITPSRIKKMTSTKKNVPFGIRKLLCPPPSSAARIVRLRSPMTVDYLLDRSGEHEQGHERQVDEVGRLDQTDRDEEGREGSTLRLGLAGDAGGQSVTGEAVPHACADCAAGHDQPTANER